MRGPGLVTLLSLLGLVLIVVTYTRLEAAARRRPGDHAVDRLYERFASVALGTAVMPVWAGLASSWRAGVGYEVSVLALGVVVGATHAWLWRSAR